MAGDIDVGAVVDNCRLEALLGSGAFGAVYRATHLGLEQPRALKFLFATHGQKPAMRKRFLNEARHTARLNHPNIVTVHNVGEHEGTPFINMEFLSGTSLASLLEQRRPGLEDALRIMEQVLAALGYAHAKALVHRDVKPENTMVTEDGHTKVVDFGLSLNTDVDVSRVTQHTKARMGTPYYMAPEQWSTSSVTPAADVWSAGVMLFELITGRLPFEGHTMLDLMRCIIQTEARPICDIDPTLPRALGELVGSMLQKDPDQRPKDGREARELLRDAVPGLFGGRPAPSGPGAAEPVQRHAAVGQTVRGVPFPDGLQALEVEEGPARYRRACDDGVMILLGGASFTMGSNQGDSDERPARKVRLSPFLIDRAPVSRRQFATFLSLWGSDRDDDGNKLLDPDVASIEKMGLSWEPTAGEGDPVTGVTWHGARTYARWAGVSLATEAQLEFAMSRMAEGGADADLLDRLVGSVRYWCADSYDDRYYAGAPDRDPCNDQKSVFASIRGLSRHMSPVRWSRTRRQMSGRHELALDLGFRCAYALIEGGA